MSPLLDEHPNALALKKALLDELPNLPGNNLLLRPGPNKKIFLKNLPKNLGNKKGPHAP